MGTPSPGDLATAPRWNFFFFHGAGGGDDIKGKEGLPGRGQENHEQLELQGKSMKSVEKKSKSGK